MSDWRGKAKCRGHDPEKWFPDPAATKTAVAAKEICRTCPVRRDCGAAALDNHDRHGIRAGLNLAVSREWLALHRYLGRQAPETVLRTGAPRAVTCARCGVEFVTKQPIRQKCPVCEQGLVNSTATIARVELLRDCGWTNGRIAAAAGMSKNTVSSLRPGRDWVHRDTEKRILAIQIDAPAEAVS